MRTGVCLTLKLELDDQETKKLKKKVKSSKKERCGMSIPRNTREALMLDKNNGNTLWAEAIANERTALEAKGVFKFHHPTNKMPSD